MWSRMDVVGFIIDMYAGETPQHSLQYTNIRGPMIFKYIMATIGDPKPTTTTTKGNIQPRHERSTIPLAQKFQNFPESRVRHSR